MKEETKRIRPYNNAISSRWPEDNKRQENGKTNQIKSNENVGDREVKTCRELYANSTVPFFFPPPAFRYCTHKGHTHESIKTLYLLSI